MQHHIITVGISLLTNFEREFETAREETRNQHPKVLEFIEKNPTEACAELNSLNSKTKFLETNQTFGVSLVRTDTQDGVFAARMIKTYLKRRRFSPIQVRLKNLGVPKTAGDSEEAQRLANEGIKDLQERIKEHIQNLRKNNPDLKIYINATAGFKAQVAVLYGIGKEMNVPVYYMHEEYQTAIELP